MEGRRYLNSSQTCELLGISKSRYYQLVHIPTFPTIRIGRRILIESEALNKWLREQEYKN